MTAERWKHVNINARGLEMFLGPLEAACMRAIWDRRVTSKKIWQYVRDHYETAKTDEIAYTSVTSTIFRLWSQGYLTRTGDKNAGFVYSPVAKNEAAFIDTHMRAAIAALVESYPREIGRIMVDHLRALRAPAEEGIAK